MYTTAQHDVKLDGDGGAIIDGQKLDGGQVEALEDSLVSAGRIEKIHQADPQKDIAENSRLMNEAIAKGDFRSAIQHFGMVSQGMSTFAGIKPVFGPPPVKVPALPGLVECGLSGYTVLKGHSVATRYFAGDAAQLKTQTDQLEVSASLHKIYQAGLGRTTPYVNALAVPVEAVSRGVYNLVKPFLPMDQVLAGDAQGMSSYFDPPVAQGQHTKKLLKHATKGITKKVTGEVEAKAKADARTQLQGELQADLAGLIQAKTDKTVK